MVPTPDLDARLRRHHEELVSLFTGRRLGPLPRRPRPLRRLVAGLAVAVVAAIAAPLATVQLMRSHTPERPVVQVAGLTITTAAASDVVAPRMTPEQAAAVVRAFEATHPVQLPHGGPPISGLTTHVAPSFVPAVERVVGPCVNIRLQYPANVWVVPVNAPPQSGWSALRGAFLVDDTTGYIDGGDLLISPAQNGPPVC